MIFFYKADYTANLNAVRTLDIDKQNCLGFPLCLGNEKFIFPTQGYMLCQY